MMVEMYHGQNRWPISCNLISDSHGLYVRISVVGQAIARETVAELADAILQIAVSQLEIIARLRKPDDSEAFL